MSSALVLAGGGEVAMAWEAGIIAGLRDRDVDLGTADLIVGTSAGSVVGAALAGGHDPSQALVPSPATGSPAVDLEVMMAAIAPMLDDSLDPGEACRLVGRNALAAKARPGTVLIDLFSARLPALDWPARRLLITAVNAATGELAVWERNSEVPLALAVASSYAVPGMSAPVTIDGRPYMDGGMRSTTNADLARGADTVVVLHPLAQFLPDAPLRAEIEALDTGDVVVVGADDAATAVFGVNVLDPALWKPAFQAGLDQAAAAAGEIRRIWTTGP